MYDVIIIGSGMGGLTCGALLSKEGFNVCVLEKNKQIGGCLQTFVRERVIFDSGVHYVGGLGKGQNLHQIFKYLGIMDKLRLEKLDEDAFDYIVFENDDNKYPMAQGYENFVQQLLKYFPDEEIAIRKYCDKMQEVCRKFPLYNLKFDENFEKGEVMQLGAKEFIESITSNTRLQEVLAGNNVLYAGLPDRAPFYVHALVLNSYIEGSWKFVDGGSQIGKYLVQIIRENGGDIKRNCTVTEIVEKNGVADHVVLDNGETLFAKNFISNVHPYNTLKMLKTELIRNAYRSRIGSLENTISCFIINIVCKKNCFKSFKHNIYFNKEGAVWDSWNYTDEEWPKNYGVFASSSSKNHEYAEGLTLFTYMQYEEVKKWENTFNTVSKEDDRGAEYEAFKKRKAEKLIDEAEKKIPGLKDCIQSYYTSTPLTYRDYIGGDDGSLYGIIRDYKEPLKTFISPKTKLPNLFFTGQNISMHGILGVTISALATCSSLVNMHEVLERIRRS
ncbi:phytoene desaturase family protein [Pinibacter soli]|uniref:NAD(P)/FAD-dependent oxidoreductase n=1 Tax=Pinibacter soli TaxID=3044211 RepID=A0ABT6R7C9_9BACT|nr:NAD(P)/FAD-dependent oxidoreductase [Pinibacter soli]MDI3318472.1 NAD(P)/FAD-dependent oxidoreductase [Pinibacter soli]